MTREEIKEAMEIIKTIYPNFQKDLPRQIKTRAIDLWAALFAGDEYDVVMAAIHGYIANETKGFPPSPGQLKEKISVITTPNAMSEIEAWSLVKKAMSNGIYNSAEEHQMLPELIQSIVSPQQIKDWATADIGSEQVVASNFMRSYRAKASQRR